MGEPDGSRPDASVSDGGSNDGGTMDGGETDGGTNDGGTMDGGETDGGSNDGGTNDGGSNDGGSNDGGSNDGGSNDGGTMDGGANDGGSNDGGTNDGGTTDGGAADGGRWVKWHPGHYLLIAPGIDLVATTPPLPPPFRGVQRQYAWRTLEPSPGVYDFSVIRRDLTFVRAVGADAGSPKYLAIQIQTHTFGATEAIPDDLIAQPALVYLNHDGLAHNPVRWSPVVMSRLSALYGALAAEFDPDPSIEAVILSETSPAFQAGDAGVLEMARVGYSDAVYADALEEETQALKASFAHTTAIQFTNYPRTILGRLAAHYLDAGVGMGGPDIFVDDPALSEEAHVPPSQGGHNYNFAGAYTYYGDLAGIVPLGTAVQWSDYEEKCSRCNPNGITQTPPADYYLLPTVQEIYEYGRDHLLLNYIFWLKRARAADSLDPRNGKTIYENLTDLLSNPVIVPPGDTGGLSATCPSSVGACVP